MLKPALLWLTMAGVYLLFAGTLSLTEIGSAGLCAGLGLAWGNAIRPGRLCLTIPLSSMRVMGKGFADVPRQMAEVGQFLMRAVWWGDARGTIRHRPLQDLWPGPARSAVTEQAGMTAIGTLAASLAPRSFVLHADTQHDRVTEHDFGQSTGKST